MTRLGSSLGVLDILPLAASGAWKELVSIDATPPARNTAPYTGPRVLHLWADIGLGGPVPYGFEAQLTLGVGDVTAIRPIIAQDTSVVCVPSNGLAIPVPSGDVRVSVRLRPGHLIANPSARIYGQISHGAPVVTEFRGGLQLTDVAGATISLDPEEFPYAQTLRVTALGAAGSINYGFGAAAIPVGATLDLPFSSKLTLSNGPGGQLLYLVKQVF